jgi:hypothetical protein
MTFSYAETRDSEQLRLLRPMITDYIAHAQGPPDPTSPSPRQTLFFFPGGLASQLLRATQAFHEGGTAPRTFDYKVVWFTLDAVDPMAGGTVRDLAMHRDAAGVFRDRGDRIIVASDQIWRELYNVFRAWCASNNLDLFIFDWDWRRRLEETVEFFVRTFLPFFQERVLAAGLPDPLARFALVGHSFGGMIVNLILRGNDPLVAGLTRAVTVGTPFYGYAGQVHRWFEGDNDFNGPSDIFKQDIMEVVASMPALYTLHFLDEATYRDRATQSGLTADPEFPLPAYPSMDATDATLRADPYNPQTNDRLVRYPRTTGFDLAELDYARLQCQLLAAPMPPDLSEKFFNIRGVRTESDEQTPKDSTPGRVTWDWIQPKFGSTDPTPIVDSGHVPGDGTQPAWSSRLATNAPARCFTVRGSDVEHMYLMKHRGILDALGSILLAPGAAMNPPSPPPPEPASDEDFIAFMRWLHSPGRGKTEWPRLDDPALPELVPEEFRDKLPAITRRLVMDVMKRPGPPGLSAALRALRPRPSRRRKPARKPTRRKAAARRQRRRAR